MLLPRVTLLWVIGSSDKFCVSCPLTLVTIVDPLDFVDDEVGCFDGIPLLAGFAVGVAALVVAVAPLFPSAGGSRAGNPA